MGKKYTHEQFWKLYKSLPQELQDALFAEETGDNTYEVCKKNGQEDKLGDIVDYVGQVLVGVLPPADFQKALEQDVGIAQEAAQKISREINRLIFYPVKTALEELYNTGISSPSEPTTTVIAEPTEQEAPQKGDDNYREPLE